LRNRWTKIFITASHFIRFCETASNIAASGGYLTLAIKRAFAMPSVVLWMNDHGQRLTKLISDHCGS